MHNQNPFKKTKGSLLAVGILFLTTLSLSAKDLPKEPESIIATFLKCWESGDSGTFSALLHSDVRFTYPGGSLNKTELLDMFTAYPAKKKDIKIYLWDEVISEEDIHVTAYEFAATDRQTEERFAVGTGVYCILKDGKIIDFREFWDSEVAMRQKKGELPLDEGGEVTPWPETVWLRHETID